jgi:hypothetical protein
MATFKSIGCFTAAQMATIGSTTPSCALAPLSEGSKLDIKQVMHPRVVANGSGGQQISSVGMASAEFDGEILMSPNLVSAVVDGAPTSGDISAALTLTTIANGDFSDLAIAVIEDVAQASETITWSPTGLTIHKNAASTNTQVINAVATEESGDAWGILTTDTPSGTVTPSVALFSDADNFSAGSADSVSPGEPDCGKYLEASGYSLSGTPPNYIYTLTPNESLWKYMAMMSYSGNKSSGECEIKKAINMMYETSIEGKIGEPLKLKLKGLGRADGIPAPGNFFTGSTTLTETIISLLKKINFTIVGETFKLYEFTITTGYKVTLVPDGSEFGYERGLLVPGPSTFKAKVMCENLATAHPFSLMVAKTVDYFEISFGDTGAGIKISSAASQLDEVPDADESGVGMFDLAGHFVDNDLAIAFNATWGM